MKELIKILSSNVEDKLKPCCEGFTGFIKKHPELSCLTLLALLCLVFLFFGLSFYPLLDVDETRYAVMARDLMNSINWDALMLNGEPFLEKPPLYFWLVGHSINLFGQFSSFAVRFPIALLASFITFATYFVGKKVISRKFGMISALILLSSIFFLILSHVAILDMVLTVFVTSSLYCGFLTHFCEEKYKKYLWCYFYVFAGLGFLSKGILAIAIPAVVIFVYNLLTKTAKEIFKPINLFPGLVAFLLITIPWHLVMYLEYGNRFIKEYFLLHHFARFIDSANIGREQPFWFFIPVFLLGFLPWSLSFVAFLIDGGKKLVAKYKKAEGKIKDKIIATLDAQTNEQKLILFASVYFFVTFIIFSASSTKLPTYILPVFPAAALLTGYFWWIADEKGEHEKAISITTELLAGTIIISATIAIVVYFFLPFDIQNKIVDFKHLAINGLLLTGMLMILRLQTKKALSIFGSYIITMIFVIMLAVIYIFNLVYKGGENEIVAYSAYANSCKSQLVTFDFAVKPSTMIKFKNHVNFLTDPEFDKLDEILKYKYGPTFVIVKNKNMQKNGYAPKIKSRLKLIHIGERYSLYVKDINNEFEPAPKQSCEQNYSYIGMDPSAKIQEEKKEVKNNDDDDKKESSEPSKNSKDEDDKD